MLLEKIFSESIRFTEPSAVMLRIGYSDGTTNIRQTVGARNQLLNWRTMMPACW